MQRHSGEHAFTLIELLTVMVVAAILFGIAFPAYISVMERARKTEAQNSEQQIVTAVNAYYTEYGKYPIDTAAKGTGVDATYSTDNNTLFDVLRNMTGATPGNALNPRGIVFIQPRTSNTNPPKSGLSSTGTIGVWYDPWGSPYNVAIDGNYNNQLANPYGGSGGAGSDPINQGVIAWALGKNGRLGGGPPATGFGSSEGGTANNFSGSGDVISWQ
jgi:prepilin-type N-terminal cleavage/methylation domain-containing protein